MRLNELEKLRSVLKQDVPEEMLFQFVYDTYQENKKKRTFWLNPTKAGWEEERKKLKEIFLDIFSPFPEKVPLNLRTTVTYKRDTYRMDGVCYDTAPGITVSANWYVPDSAVPGKTPTVVLACGHNQSAKSFYRHVAEAMVKAGIAVLCFDPPEQGERHSAWNFVRWYARTWIDHDYLGALAMLTGGNLAGAFAWDCMRAVDFVLAMPETDPERIGFTGTSGGGLQTIWTVALDDRICAAAPSCFITSIDELLKSREPTDAEQNHPGILEYGLEHRDFLAMMAPKPLLVLGAEDDYFPIAGTEDTVNSLKKLYACYDAEEKVELCRSPGGHAGSGAMSTKGLQFFCRWFGLPIPEFPEGEAQRIDEMVENIPDDEDTFASSGQLVFEGHCSNYWNYYRRRIRELKTPEVKVENLRKMLAIVDFPEPAEIKRYDTAPLQTGCITSEKGIIIPWIYARAGDTPSKKLCVLSHEDGMVSLFGNGREAELFLQRGVDVLTFDPRAVGTTRGGCYGWFADIARRYLKGMRDEKALPDGVLGYVDPEYEGVYSSGQEMGMHGLKLNRPLLGQRVTDTLRVLESIHAITGHTYEENILYGSGYSATWMLYAALLTRLPISSTVFHGMLASLKLIADLPESRYALEHLARGQLLCGDFPDLLKALPCKQLLVDPQNAMRLPLEPILGQHILRDVPGQVIYTEGDANPLFLIADYITAN